MFPLPGLLHYFYICSISNFVYHVYTEIPISVYRSRGAGSKVGWQRGTSAFCAEGEEKEGGREHAPLENVLISKALKRYFQHLKDVLTNNY